MFKRLVVSIVLGVSMLSSIALWAKNDRQPTVVAKLDVMHQLSISEHNLGGDRFIKQVSDEPSALSLIQTTDGVPMPFLSVLGILVFGLMYFVLRSSRNGIK